MAREGWQFVKYSFFKLAPEWKRLSSAEKDAGKKELTAVLDEFSDKMLVRSYSLTGIRGDTDFMLWLATPEVDMLQQLGARINATRVGPFLDIPYSYLAMTRRSMYIDSHSHAGQERLTVHPVGAKYLIVYPFVKSRPWYELPKEKRQEMMNEHIGIGHRFPGVKINTSYSYGLDDQEFVLAFETNDLAEFLDLVMVLRETKASMYTVQDTPSFTCVSMDIGQALNMVG